MLLVLHGHMRCTEANDISSGAFYLLVIGDKNNTVTVF